MRLKSVCGDTLFKSSYVTVKESLEEAVAEGVCLDGINLRKAKLTGAQLDMAKMKKACFWGADLTGADMSDGCFEGADFRTAILKETCLSESTCKGANFHGAYCNQMLIDGTDLSACQFSCPSIFSCDLATAGCLKGAIYAHQGEIECPLSSSPIIIRGLDQPIVIMGQDILIGTTHQRLDIAARPQKIILDQLRRKLFAQL